MKNNLIKKFVLYAFVIIYDVVSLLWCYIFIETMIFNFTNTKIGYFGPDVTAHAVGGIDTTSHEFIIKNILGSILPAIFIHLTVVTTFLLTMSVLKKQMSRKSNILLSIFAAISLMMIFVMPERASFFTYYKLMREARIIQYSLLFYILISLIIIVTNILFAIKRSNETQ